MKVLVQRVSRGEVRVEGTVVGSIGAGVLVLLGVERGDDEREARALADKTADLRIFSDEAGRMSRSVLECGFAALVVSQFTLAGSTRRGRRPSFTEAAEPELAERLYRVYVGQLRSRGVPVSTGTFRAMMEVESVNDGPVTLLLDPITDRPGRT
jgi:D-tyrosyl-tRNA(Tyr) deacylase